MSGINYAEAIKRKALELGFVKAGIAPAKPLDFYYSDIMQREDYQPYLADKRQFIQNCRLTERYPEAKSILSVAYGYANVAYPEKLTKYIGRAYQARCYGPLEGINKARLDLMRAYIESLGIGVIDAYLPDRAAAAMAGVITYGRNNFAYVDGYGSFVILNTFILDTELDYDEPTVTCLCPPGCNRCKEACPTGALLDAGRLHPQDCIAYLDFMTQEEKGNDPFIAPEKMELMGTRIHGCDFCQEVCPRNRAALNAEPMKDPYLEKLAEEFDLEKVLFMTDEYYQNVIKPIMYNYISSYRYFRRNAAIAMGNSGEEKYIPALEKACKDEDPVIRDAAAWAIGRLKD